MSKFYRCDNCGVRFDEPLYVRDDQYHSEVDCTEQRTRAICPCCGTDWFRLQEEDDTNGKI